MPKRENNTAPLELSRLTEKGNRRSRLQPQEYPMRYVSLCSAILVATILFAAPTTVDAAGWCLLSSGRGASGTLCRFRTFEQCMASAGGTGGSCVQDSSTETTPSKTRTKASGTEQKKKTTPDTASKPQPEPAKAKEQPAKQATPTQAPAAPTSTPQAAALQDPGLKFAAARDLILAGQYEAGIKAMQALGFDKHPDVAAYVGLAHNKLGRVAEARSWYDKALAGNPKHLLTLSYYGMLRAEQGEMQKAQADLATIKGLCGGTSCKEYVALQATIASKKR
ncbi:MAG: DUF3551 domain-containing protein [Xanthobacteraceae bacterium]